MKRTYHISRNSFGTLQSVNEVKTVRAEAQDRRNFQELVLQESKKLNPSLYSEEFRL